MELVITTGSVSCALLLACTFLLAVENGRSDQNWKWNDIRGKLSAKEKLNDRYTSQQINQKSCDSGSHDVNDWIPLGAWTCSAPDGERAGSAAFSTPVNVERALHRILVLGVNSANNDSDFGDVIFYATWIYYEETNSWRIVNSQPHGGPPWLDSPTLVTLCNEYVILLHDNLINNNSTWIFFTKTEEWQKVAIIRKGHTRMPLRIGSDIPVAVSDLSTSCSCRESVILFHCDSNNSLTLFHELRCVDEAKTYAWEERRAKSPGTPKGAVCSSFTTSMSKDIVFAIVEQCLWHFSVKTTMWTPTTSCSQKLAFMKVALAFASVNRSDPESYMFFNIVGRPVIRLSMSNFPISEERILGYAPVIMTIFSMRVLNRNHILAYIKEYHDSCESSKWSLEKDDTCGVWFWTKLSISNRYPPERFNAIPSSWKQNYFVLQSAHFRDDGSPERNYVSWSLDLLTMRWDGSRGLIGTEQTFGGGSVSVWLNDSVLLIVSQSYRNTIIIKSMDSVTLKRYPEPVRSDFSLVAVNGTSALMFGGRTEFETLNDLWLFSSVTNDWTQLLIDTNRTPTPSPRYAHVAVVSKSEMFIYAGRNLSDICYEEMWKFNLITAKWSRVTSINEGPRLDSMAPCFAHVACQAGHIWIAVGCSQLFSDTCLSSEIQLWMFIIHLEMWQYLTIYQPDLSAYATGNPVAPMVFWRGYLMRIDTFSVTLHYMKLGCPKGLSSANISKVSCDICELGSYADVGSERCLQCPEWTTTTGPSSTTISDCSVCVQGYCKDGQCLVVWRTSMPVPFCQCHLGFTGSRCQYATYYYISLGVVLFVVVISLALTVIWYTRRKRKLREKALRQQIEQLNEVWQIGWEEVTMLEEIGGGASGMVWLARYRDITVAVKMLRDLDDQETSLKFAQEIKFMQTMRHPNIVLFLGAGRTTFERQPFLVIEFTRHGSLRKVLDDRNIQLTERQKIQFALDASKGMSFLHNLDPPRIHRDLKSDNLLVSESWTVKVADFGLGRPFYSERRHPPVRRRIFSAFRNKAIMEPLLEMRENLSRDGIGTARWSAPEILQGQTYDASIDVYRYAYETKHYVAFIA